MHITFATGCAWRAMYIYSGPRPKSAFDAGPLRFSIGIDPTKRHNRAELFGSIGFRRDCTGGRKAAWHWRLPLWKSRHWHKLDGRRKMNR